MARKSFPGVYFSGLGLFLVLWELILAVRTDWLFSLRINFSDVEKVPSTQYPALTIFLLFEVFIHIIHIFKQHNGMRSGYVKPVIRCISFC